jgi:hypothetical protein
MPSSIARILPRPRPARHPLWRKIYLWLISLIGTGLCIALMATGLAPSPGYHQQPAEAALGAAGIVCAAWIALYARRIPVGAVSDAMKHVAARDKARELLARDPELAVELKVGRPDLPRAFDDGGLVDINRVPASWLAELPGLDERLARRITEVREEVGGFSSAADVEFTLTLAPGRLNEAESRLIFRPLR